MLSAGALAQRFKLLDDRLSSRVFSAICTSSQVPSAFFLCVGQFGLAAIDLGAEFAVESSAASLSLSFSSWASQRCESSTSVCVSAIF